jgi:hypothetical protein
MAESFIILIPLVKAGGSPPVMFFRRASSRRRKPLPMQDYCKALRRKTTAPLDRTCWHDLGRTSFQVQEKGDLASRDFELLSHTAGDGAAREDRTLDLSLTKGVLYH